MFWFFITRFFIILGIVLFFIFILIRFSGNWKKTAKRIIKRYAEYLQMEPNCSPKEVFFAVLDNRYPSNNFATKHLHIEKEKLKERIPHEIKSNSSIFNKYNLPLLIYCCLVIERNSILYKKNSEGIKKLLKDIENEVRKHGLEQYI